MKIWVIGRGYPTTANRMWGSFEFEQAKLLARHGHDVSYIAVTLSFFNRKDPRGLRCFENSGIKIYSFSHFYFPGKAGIYLEKFEDKCWRKVFEAAEKDSGLPELIHIHYPSMLSSINEVEKLRKKGVRIFVTEHWSRVLVNNLKKHEKARLEYYTTHANCFICVSRILQNAVKKLTNVTVPMEIIPNIVSPLFFDSKPAKKESNVFTFVAVGRLVPLKQFDVIIEQFKLAFPGNDRVRLKIIGSGPERRKLEKTAAGSQNIIFTGTLPQAEVVKELSDADVLISFSKYETFAVPVAEAWACGLPIITLKSVPVSAYCDNTRGIIIHEDDRNNLGKTMKSIMKNYDNYDKESIARFAKDNFSDEAIYSRLISIYKGDPNDPEKSV